MSDEYLNTAYNNKDITFYLNPNSGIFQLETNFPLSEIGNFKVIDLIGTTVFETQNLTSNTIQLSTAATGQFFVVAILKDGSVVTKKMMVGRSKTVRGSHYFIVKLKVIAQL